MFTQVIDAGWSPFSIDKLSGVVIRISVVINLVFDITYRYNSSIRCLVSWTLRRQVSCISDRLFPSILIEPLSWPIMTVSVAWRHELPSCGVRCVPWPCCYLFSMWRQEYDITWPPAKHIVHCTVYFSIRGKLRVIWAY